MENLNRDNLYPSREDTKVENQTKHLCAESVDEVVTHDVDCNVSKASNNVDLPTFTEENEQSVEALSNPSAAARSDGDPVLPGDTVEVKSDVERKTKEKWDEMIVYNQFTRIRDTGKVIYKGEDAYPYLGKNIFFVADGLGGTGASTHSKFDPELFDEDKIVEKLFGGIFDYDDIEDPEFCAYVRKSFMELISIKDCYHDNRNNMKHSAYFGSRLTCSIILQMMKNVEGFNPERLFDELRHAEDRDALMLKIGKFVAEYIKDHLLKITSKVGLEHESAQAKQNFKLMATSLCAAIYLEKDDHIELFYMNAGDSRAYMWDKNGLHQVVRDQESADGGMTNFIYAEPDEKFDIECKYLRLDKPCILFNATDGCFDAHPFMLSPLAFEKYILETILTSDSLAEAGKTMGEFFMADPNRNDDSSTMAMKVFGYESLGQLKDVVRARLEKINADYLDGFEDLLACDYVRKNSLIEVNFGKQLKTLKPRCMEDEAIIAYCEGKIDSEPGERFKAELQDNVKKHRDCNQQIEEMRKVLDNVFVRNLDYWITELNLSIPNISEVNIKQQQRRRQEICAQIETFMTTVGKQSSKAEDSLTQIKSLLSKINGVGDFGGRFSNEIKSVKRELDDIISFIDAINSNRNKTAKQIRNDMLSYFDQNKKLAKLADGECFKLFIDEMLSCTDFEKFSLFLEDIEDLKFAVETYSTQLDIKKELEDYKRMKLRQEALNYLDANFMQIAKLIVNQSIDGVSEELVSEIKAFWEVYETERLLTSDKSSKQKSLFEKYDDEHYKFIEGEA